MSARAILEPIGPNVGMDNIILVEGDNRRHVGTVGKKGCGHEGPYAISLTGECTEHEVATIKEAVARRDGTPVEKVKSPPPESPRG